MVYITRRERFNAAHRLYRKEWSDDKNFEVFGKCAHPNWHGHNFELFITVKGELDEQSGFVMNLKELSGLVRRKVIEPLDHKNINIDVSFMQGKIASTENLAVSIWNELVDDIKKMGAQLHCIKLSETENNFVEYYGKNG